MSGIACYNCGNSVFVHRDVSYARKVTGTASCNGCGEKVEWESPKNASYIKNRN